MHPDQLTITVGQVAELIASQFPQWRSLPVSQLRCGGTVHAVFRVGTDLVARLPLQPGDPAEVRTRLAGVATAASRLRGRTRFPTPRPVGLGTPGAGYPLPWLVQTWLPGVTAVEDDPAGSAVFAHDLAEFVAGVRSIDTRGATFAGDGRGGDLRNHDEWVHTCLDRSGSLVDVDALARRWSSLHDLPRTAPDVMTHGDLVPGNVLVAGDALAGVLDVDSLGPADPALDLVGAWHLLDAGPRAEFRATLGCDDLDWARGQAWALEQALGLGWYYRTSHPALSQVGVRTMQRILAAA